MVLVVLVVYLCSFLLVSAVERVNLLSMEHLALSVLFDCCDHSGCVNHLVIYRDNYRVVHNISNQIYISHLLSDMPHNIRQYDLQHKHLGMHHLNKRKKYQQKLIILIFIISLIQIVPSLVSVLDGFSIFCVGLVTGAEVVVILIGFCVVD